MADVEETAVEETAPPRDAAAPPTDEGGRPDPEISWSDVLPEGMDEAGFGWFREVAAAQGFRKNQVEALVHAYGREAAAAPERMRREAEKILKAEYGGEYEAKIATARDAARRFDRMCGGTDEAPGALGKILRMGLGNHPDFIRAMAMIGEAVSDSAMPGVPSGGGSDAMTTEEFLNAVMAGK